MSDRYRCCAFTLAEVLITLGIIGIVAAMTIPTVVHKVHNIQLEMAFKKSYANLQNAFRSTLNDDFAPIDVTSWTPNPEFAKQLYLKYKSVKSIRDANLYKGGIKTYTKDNFASTMQCSNPHQTLVYYSYSFSDGSRIGSVYNCYKLYIILDTNGPLQGPNAYGHDIFIFYANNNSKGLDGLNSDSVYIPNDQGNNVLTGSTACSKTSTSPINGVSCTQYAIKNICPDDPSKKYWDCLP